MDICLARSEDEPAVRDYVCNAYAKYLKRMGRTPAPMSAAYDTLIADGAVHVGREGARILGILVCYSTGSALLVENVAVQPGAQGHGLGRMLMAFAEERARQLGLPAVELYTNEAMTENLAFYPRLGYVETGRRLDEGYRRVFFRKEL